MKDQTFRGTLSFDRAEISGTKDLIGMDCAGIKIVRAPEGMDFDKYRNSFERKHDWLDFGSLWSSSNDPKFYENLKMNDVTPKKEDFVEVPFRLISATIVGAHSWKATDFSDETVLKASTQMLDGKPIYKDHETDLDNWVGLVNGVKWDASFTDDTGIKVPAGIDGMMAVDMKTNPKVARGVLMGSVYSNSVTVEFDWKPSHNFDNVHEFYDQLGKYHQDGKMVRRIVTLIHNYHESSLVWLGADPFAKMKMPSGNLKNIDVSSIEYAKATYGEVIPDNGAYQKDSDEVKEYDKSKRYTVAFGFDKSLEPLSRKGTAAPAKEDEEKTKKFNMDPKLLALLKICFGIAETEELTEAQAMERLGKSVVVDKTAFDADKVKLEQHGPLMALVAPVLKDAEGKEIPFSAEIISKHTLVAADKLSTLEAQSGQVETLTKEKEALAADAKLGQDYLNLQRAEGIRMYRNAVGPDKVDEAVIGLFNKASVEELTGLMKQHGQSLVVKYAGHCTKCNSADNVTFRSSIGDGGAKNESSVETYAHTSDDFYKQHSKRPMFGKPAVENKN